MGYGWRFNGHSPSNRSVDFVKRVIALPGEMVEVRKGRVLIDGQRLNAFYAEYPAAYDYGLARVGQNELFVLGDNRDNSFDSHLWGMLACSLVTHKVWIAYWPPAYWGFVR